LPNSKAACQGIFEELNSFLIFIQKQTNKTKKKILLRFWFKKINIKASNKSMSLYRHVLLAGEVDSMSFGVSSPLNCIRVD